jgi:hypothetical protein
MPDLDVAWVEENILPIRCMPPLNIHERCEHVMPKLSFK